MQFTSSARTRRLFIKAPLEPGGRLMLDRAQAHYVTHVVRLKAGDTVLVFNGRDGEWRGAIEAERKTVAVLIAERTRPQGPPADLDYLFAPLKHARLDYMVQKATELGAARLRPVMTRHTDVARVNIERMATNAVEAAEQCGITWVPEVLEPAPLDALLDDWPRERTLVFADEAAPVGSPVEALAGLRGRPLSLLIGPEGGFSGEERARLLALPSTVAISLGPRIMRADTAAVAALALVQALAGDWSVSPG